MELYDLNYVLSAHLYGLPISKRLGYVEMVLQIARASVGGVLRALLSNKKFVYPDIGERRLFHRGAPQSYCTFPQACNRYLITSPWDCYLEQFLSGSPEPNTGEVLESGLIVQAPGDRGWKDIRRGFKGKKGRTRHYASRAIDPTGSYINPWYLDGLSHRSGAKLAIST